MTCTSRLREGERVCPWSVLRAQSCRTLCGPMDCSPPGSSVHGTSQARILEWAASLFSRGSSRPRDRSCASCIAVWFFTTEPLGDINPRDSGTILLGGAVFAGGLRFNQGRKDPDAGKD